MNRRYIGGLLLFLTCGCGGGEPATTPAPQTQTSHTASAKPPKKQEPPEEPLANFDPSKFSLGDDAPPAESKPEPVPAEKMTAEAPTKSEPVAVDDVTDWSAISFDQLPKVVVPGLGPAATPFAGVSDPDDTEIPDDLYEVLESEDPNNFDAIAKLALTHPTPQVRAAAAKYLLSVDHQRDDDAVRILRGLLKDPDANVQRVVTDRLRVAIYKSKFDGALFLGELADLIGNPNSPEYIYGVLLEIGEPIPSLAPQLLWALHQPNYPHLDQVAECVGLVGPAGKAAIPRLTEIVQAQRGVFDGEHAAKSLGRLGAEKELFALLQDQDHTIRRDAVIGAGYLSEPSPRIIQRVIEQASDPSSNLRGAVMITLGKFRPSQPAYAATLIHAAENEKGNGGLEEKFEQGHVRHMAYRSMGELDPQFPEVIPVLYAALEREDEDMVLRTIRESIASCDKISVDSVAPLLRRLLSGDIDVRIAMQEDGARYRKALLEFATQEKRPTEIRAAAFWGISIIATDDAISFNDRQALKALARSQLGEETPGEIRGAAALVITSMPGEPSDKALSALVAGITQEKVAGLRGECAEMACELAYEPALPALLELIRKQDKPSMSNFLHDLSEISGAQAAIPLLIDLPLDPNDDEDQSLCIDIIRAIGEIGGEPEQSAAYLKKIIALPSDDGYLGSIALESLADVVVKTKQDPSEIIAILSEKLSLPQDDQYDLVESACSAAMTLGPQATPLVPQLTKVLQSEYEGLADAAAGALGEIGPAAQASAPEIVAAIGRYEDLGQAYEALPKLQAGGEELAKAAPQLLARDSDRVTCLICLTEMGPSVGGAAPAVFKILKSDDPEEQHFAIEALGAMGPAAKLATARLIELATDEENDEFVDVAREALAKIAPDDPEVVELLKADD